MTNQLEQRFISRMRELLVVLPFDLKVLFEAMTDDELETEVRRLAAGGVVYCLAPSDPIPDSMGLVGFVDDVVVVRKILARMLAAGGTAIGSYPERFEDQFRGLTADLELFGHYLGETLQWVDWKIDKLAEMKFKGQTVVRYAEDSEMGQRLYQDGLQFATDYDIDDDTATRLTSGRPVLEAFRRVYEVESARHR